MICHCYYWRGIGTQAFLAPGVTNMLKNECVIFHQRCGSRFLFLRIFLKILNQTCKTYRTIQQTVFHNHMAFPQWLSATSNCGGLRPRMASPVTQECCGLWPQQTVAASGGKIPYVFKEMVTKTLPGYRFRHQQQQKHWS